MTKTAMINEMLDANYVPAIKQTTPSYIIKKYGILSEKAKEFAFNHLKWHTGRTKIVEKLYNNFKLADALN